MSRKRIPSLAELQARQPEGEPLKFNRWTPLEEINGKWCCRCDCGEIRLTQKSHVASGASRSCGCWNRERTAESNVNRTKHGMTGTPEYASWQAMKSRCRPQTDQNHLDHYHNRGIRVCRRWNDSFEAFYADMGPRSDEHTVDRADNSRGYDCGRHGLCEDCRERSAAPNCRWATATEQTRNRTITRTLTHDGRTMTINEWVPVVGKDYTTILARIYRGWPDSEALTAPLVQESRCRGTRKTTSPAASPPSDDPEPSAEGSD